MYEIFVDLFSDLMSIINRPSLKRNNFQTSILKIATRAIATHTEKPPVISGSALNIPTDSILLALIFELNMLSVN